jgi:putative peptide zinc metalloprotease protein
MLEQETAARTVRLRSHVGRVKRDSGRIILVDSTGGTLPVRVSAIADELLPLLMSGVSVDELAGVLRHRHPQARDVRQKLAAFLAQLEAAGMLETSQARTRRRLQAPRWRLPNPDRLARQIAAGLHRVPRLVRRVLLALVVGAALLALGWRIGDRALRPHLIDVVRQFDAWGLALGLGVLMPLHELAHAVACRAAGVPVRGAGVVLHGFLVPGPYVDTTDAYLVSDRWRRFWIPAAGPLMDLLVAGAGAAGALATHGVWAHRCAYASLIASIFVFLDLNPFGPTDGSHMLEAWLDDELARLTALSRRRARMSPVSSKYRLACIAYLLVAVAAAVALR